MNYLKTADLEILVTRIVTTFPDVLFWIESQAMEAYHRESQDFEELNTLLCGMTTSFLDNDDSTPIIESMGCIEGTPRLNTYLFKSDAAAFEADRQALEPTAPTDTTTQSVANEETNANTIAKNTRVSKVSDPPKSIAKAEEVPLQNFRFGMIFKASSKTYKECISRMLFGLPSNQWDR
jgi:hypothetical protein